MADSARLVLPLVASGQSGGEVTHNSAVQLIDALLHINVKDRDLTAPPGSPASGDTYLIAPSPTGAWSGHAGTIAIYNSGWTFVTPIEGMWIWVGDEDRHLRFDGTNWLGSPHVLYVNTASSSAIANTTSETDFSVLKNVPAGYLNFVGKAFRLIATGQISLVSSATMQLRFKWGSTTLLDWGTQNFGTGATSAGWSIDMIGVVRSTGASGTLQVNGGQVAVTGRAGAVPAPGLKTLDFTSAADLKVSAQWSAASVSNSITLETYLLEVLT